MEKRKKRRERRNQKKEQIKRKQDIAEKKSHSKTKNIPNQKKHLRFLLNSFYLISCLFLCASVINVVIWYKDRTDTNRIQKYLQEETTIKKEEITLDKEQEEEKNTSSGEDLPNDTYTPTHDFTKLKEENPDTVGWIKIERTPIDYPIVQSSDNRYYLKHSFDKSENSVGWIFLDFRNNLEEFNSNTVIYGHGRLDDTMFGSLRHLLNEDWYQKNKELYIEIETEDEFHIFQVFSIYTIYKENYYITTSFETEDTYQEFLDTIKKRSQIDFNTTPLKTDKILTLSTCQDNYGNRIVVHAQEIKKGTS